MYRPSQRPSFRFRMFPSPFARRFGMVSAPFDNEQYRNQGDKATEKRNRYQKVIICTSEPRRLIFDYCGAIFALPEAFFFGYSGAIFERSRSLFIDCYEMTLVKGKIACQKQIFEQGHVRRAETIRIPALATLLYVDWLPQVNGPPGALLSSVVDHESAIIVNT